MTLSPSIKKLQFSYQLDAFQQLVNLAALCQNGLNVFLNDEPAAEEDRITVDVHVGRLVQILHAIHRFGVQESLGRDVVQEDENHEYAWQEVAVVVADLPAAKDMAGMMIFRVLRDLFGGKAWDLGFGSNFAVINYFNTHIRLHEPKTAWYMKTNIYTSSFTDTSARNQDYIHPR